jgi:DNA repair photolyase
MEINLIRTQRILSPTNISLARYAINPYRGCDFGCIYCYAKLAKNITKNENKLGVKINAAQMLDKELRYRKIKEVVLGTSCECFMDIERKYRITEAIIKVLNKHKVSFTVLTKSTLVKDYLDLIGKNKNNRIFFTFNLSDEKIKSILEDKSPPLQERIFTLKQIKKAGISLRVHIGPFIPFLSQIENIFYAIRGITNHINIELYHSKMGNFPALNQRIISFAPAIAKKIEHIYKNKDSYYNFSEDLERSLREINKKHNLTIYLVIPQFDKYYDSRINYENTFF